MLVSCGHFGCGPGPLGPLLWKMLKKGSQNGRQNQDKFNDVLSFCGKCQFETAFGLRLCSRIRVPAPCFQPLSLHWDPLFFQHLFNVFWAQPGDFKKHRIWNAAAEPAKSASEAGPSYLSIRTKPLCTCTSEPRWGLLHAAWWARPSSPRPDL